MQCAGTMAKTMKIRPSCYKPQLSFNTTGKKKKNMCQLSFWKWTEGELWYSHEAAVGFSTSASTSNMYIHLHKIKCARSLESFANVQLALISHVETHNAPYLQVSCDPIRWIKWDSIICRPGPVFPWRRRQAPDATHLRPHCLALLFVSRQGSFLMSLTLITQIPAWLSWF